MSNVVPSSFQAASQELIAKLIKAGYLRPALRNDADAVTTAIARLKQDLRGAGVETTGDLDSKFMAKAPVPKPSCRLDALKTVTDLFT